MVDSFHRLFNNSISPAELVRRVFMYNELEMIVVEADMACLRTLYCYLSLRSEDIHKRPLPLQRLVTF
jgi:hypothetical protein